MTIDKLTKNVHILFWIVERNERVTVTANVKLAVVFRRIRNSKTKQIAFPGRRLTDGAFPPAASALRNCSKLRPPSR